MDAAVSASWSKVTVAYEGYQPIWLFSDETKRLHYQLIEPQEPAIPYGERPRRYLIHGGGWGMGTYQSKIPILQAAGLDLDIVAYDPREAEVPERGTALLYGRSDMVALAQRSPTASTSFRRLARSMPGAPPSFRNRPDSHELLHLARQARAIISKPGGATLLDSWAAATPLVMLEPFGDYEAQERRPLAGDGVRHARSTSGRGWGLPRRRWSRCIATCCARRGRCRIMWRRWCPRFEEYLLSPSLA